MQQVLDNIESAIQRCQDAAASLEKVLAGITHRRDLAALEEATKKSNREFRQVRDEMLAMLGAVLSESKDPIVELRRNAIQGLVRKYPESALKIKLDEHLAKSADQQGKPITPNMREGIGAFGQLLETTVPKARLDALTKHLRYVSCHLRTKHSLKATVSAPTSIHQGDVVQGSKFIANIVDGGQGMADVNKESKEKLRVLRTRLAGLEPQPWDAIEAWVASARPLIQEHYAKHFDGFLAVTIEPTRSHAGRMVTGDGFWEPVRDNYAEAEATDKREHRKGAISAKAKILAFLDGLLDLPGVEPAPRPREGTGTMSKDRSNILNHQEILDLRGAIISARLSESRRALLAHLSAEFVASLPVASSPGEQVLMDLDALNRAGALTDGSVPLAAWLRNAVQLCGGRQEEKLFVDALEQVRGGSASPAHSKATKRAGQELAQPAATIVHHHHGDTHMGSKFTTNISGDTKIGAFGQGDNITVNGNLTVGAPGPFTQEQHKAAISAAQTALVHDQDALQRIDDRLYEALGQFLTLARKIQVEQQSLAEVQAQMKATLDEVWAQQEAKGMKPKLLPKTLEVAESLLKSPAMTEVAKKLLGA